MIRTLWPLLALLASPVSAQVLTFPSNAQLTREELSADDSYVMPLDIWDRGAMPSQVVEGRITRQAWRIASGGLTTLQIVRPLREQLRNARYRIIFECQTEACGGFDFRFAVDVLPPPEMRVNLGDFRFLAAERRGADGPEYVTLMISRAGQAGFVQITQISPPESAEAPLANAAAAPVGIAPAAGTLAEQLDVVGHAVLADLTFETGSAQLGAGDYPSLQALADYLAQNPDRQVALVGHTDAAGGLEANIALSKRRAASVLERLVSAYGADRGQLAAEGMGYLAPIASNLTEEGREANRRVEVIVTSTSE